MGMSEVGSSAVKSEPNIVPFTDILLVLLVIFMIVTPALTKGANVSLPEASNTMDQPKSGEMLTVHLTDGGKIYVSDTLITDISKVAAEVEEQLTNKKQKGGKILLRADNNVQYGKVVDLMNELKNAQVEDVGLLVEKVASSY